MNKVWSLDKLYKGFKDPKFIKDEKELDKLIKEYTSFTNNIGKDEYKDLRKYIEYSIKLRELVDLLTAYPGLRSEANTRDSEAKAVMGRLMQKISNLSAPDAKAVKFISSIKDVDKYIKKDSLLLEHEFFIKEIQELAKHTLTPDAENILSLYQISGSRAWGELQGYLTATVPVEYKGKIENLSSIRNMAYNASKAIRKSAYEAEIKAYDRIKDGIAYSLNSIKLEIINEMRLRKFKSPLDQTLKRERMSEKTLNALISAMEEYLPKFWQYLRAKAKLLGYNNGLPWYELFAPLKSNIKKFTTQECKDFLVNLFATFDKEESDFIKGAFDNEWIDFFPRDGKVGGAFCAGIHKIGESRILTNFGGELGDCITLAHELGHGFHDHFLSKQSVLNIDTPMCLAETASTFNELVAVNAAIEQEKSKVNKRALIEIQLQDATQIICDIYSRYLFETKVFAERNDKFMLPDELCKIMTEAQKKAYGNGLDQKCLHPYMWACKSHYYSGLSFYNFPYAFGGLFARGLYAQYLKEGDKFIPKYKKMLSSTGLMPIEDVAKIAGIDITKKEFWKSSLQILADEINEFKRLCK